MEKVNWNNIRSHIVAEALEEMRMFVTLKNRNALYNVLKNHFKVDDEELNVISKEFYYSNYDMPLFQEICKFLGEKSDPKFTYDIKPTLRKKELAAISTALDTMVITILRCKCSMSNLSTLKFNMAVELSETYDIATPEFVKWYEDLFNDLTERIKEEVNLRHYIDFKISEDIKSQADKVDHELFTKMILYIRSVLSDNLNHSLSEQK